MHSKPMEINHTVKKQFNMELLFQLRELVIKYSTLLDNVILIFNVRFIL